MLRAARSSVHRALGLEPAQRVGSRGGRAITWLGIVHPIVALGCANEHPPPANGDGLARHEAHGAKHLRLDQRADDEARHCHCVLGNVGEAQPGQHHALDPIVALAGVGPLQFDAADLLPDGTQIVVVLAVGARQVILLVQVLDADGIEPLEGMARSHRHDEALAIEGQRVEPIVRVLRAAEQGDVDVSLGQQLLQLARRRILDVDRPVIALAEGREQLDQTMRTDGALRPTVRRVLSSNGKRLGALAHLLHLHQLQSGDA
jgi:hypothetical protein